MSTYAATKHAVEGYSESLDHEVRGFGVRVIVVEPAVTRTNLGRHNGDAHERLAAYDIDRQRVIARANDTIERGVDPAIVAQVVLRAATDATPRLHYPVGRVAKFLRLLRSIAPAAMVDQGVRKGFGLAS